MRDFALDAIVGTFWCGGGVFVIFSIVNFISHLGR